MFWKKKQKIPPFNKYIETIDLSRAIDGDMVIDIKLKTDVLKYACTKAISSQFGLMTSTPVVNGFSVYVPYSDNDPITWKHMDSDSLYDFLRSIIRLIEREHERHSENYRMFNDVLDSLHTNEGIKKEK
jgi:hypothetical protein